MAAEGGTSGKNTSTQQDQIQATSQSGPVVGHDGNINQGTSINHSGSGSVAITDGGAVDRAFDFGEAVVLGQSSYAAETLKANQTFLDGVASIIASNSAGGANEAQNKLLLYLGIGALAVFALLFFRR
jgi:hypothetical protein